MTATVSDCMGLMVAVALRSFEFSSWMLNPSEKSRVTSTMETSLTSTCGVRGI